MKLLSLVIAGVLFTASVSPAGAKLPRKADQKPEPKAEKALYQCFFDKPVAVRDMATKMMIRHGRTYVVVFLWQGTEQTPSILMAYPYNAGRASVFPSIYAIDRDFDGEYDEEWNDMQGNGRCDQMRQFPVMKDTDKEM